MNFKSKNYLSLTKILFSNKGKFCCFIKIIKTRKKYDLAQKHIKKFSDCKECFFSKKNAQQKRKFNKNKIFNKKVVILPKSHIKKNFFSKTFFLSYAIS